MAERRSALEVTSHVETYARKQVVFWAYIAFDVTFSAP
jgi:hypothetical protein